MVVNGSLSKTAVNGDAGARSQMSGLTLAVLIARTARPQVAPLAPLDAENVRTRVRDVLAVAEPDGEPPLYPTVSAALAAAGEAPQQPFTGNG